MFTIERAVVPKAQTKANKINEKINFESTCVEKNSRNRIPIKEIKNPISGKTGDNSTIVEKRNVFINYKNRVI